jgi:hypothetical protein
VADEAGELGRGIRALFARFWKVFSGAKDKSVDQAQIEFDDAGILSRYSRGLAYLIFQRGKHRAHTNQHVMDQDGITFGKLATLLGELNLGKKPLHSRQKDGVYKPR